MNETRTSGVEVPKCTWNALKNLEDDSRKSELHENKNGKSFYKQHLKIFILPSQLFKKQ